MAKASTNKARQIVFNDSSTEALEALKKSTGMNNSQAVATALKLAQIIIEAQDNGDKVIIEGHGERETLRLVS